ncbi:MAG: ATP-binding cassette domain-containing protein, partial [Pyrinomonadaceae bacterium]
LVGLPREMLKRYPAQLSGGQRQRVGVARALASDPDLLLLDEPFGALDAITRTNLQTEFARLVRELGKTAVFVTHDLQEAMRLGSRIALMERGRIVLLDSADNFRRSEIPLVRSYLETILVPA